MSSSHAGLSVRERNKIRLRDELLEAVLDLYAEAGIVGCTVENIAHYAGCAKATVYTYFPGGRDEMLCSLYERLSLEVSAEGARLRDQAGTVHGRIMGLAEALLEKAARPRAGKFFAQLNPALSPVLRPVLGRSSQFYVKLLTEDLSSQALSTKRDATEIKTLAILLVGALREASVKVAENPRRKTELLAGIAVLAESLLYSLRSKKLGKQK